MSRVIDEIYNWNSGPKNEDEYRTHSRRVGEDDGILLLGVAKDQQHHIHHHIRIHHEVKDQQ